MPETNPTPFILVGSFLVFYMLEPLLAAQPIPRTRMRHTFNNVVIAVINIAVLAASGLMVLHVAKTVSEEQWGLLNWFGLGVHPILQAVTYDFFNYAMHVLNHKFDFLWRFHRSHHADYYLDVTSAFRFHPAESIIRGTWQCLVIFVMGFSTESMFFYQLWAIFALNSSHTNLRIPDGIHAIGKYFFVLPNIHRFHHSTARNEHDSNYGIGFMIWDHLFGTFKEPKRVGDFRIGLDGYYAENDSIKSVLLDPVAKK